MAGNMLLLLAGLAVYSGYGLMGLLVLLGAAMLSFLAGLLTEKFRAAAWISVGLSAAALLALKLQPAVGMAFAAPLGMSYVTLQMISYNVDVRRGNYPPERSFLRYALFVTYLPHLFLGPIERYDRFMQALDTKRISWDGLSRGAARALWGLFKKFAIASRAGVLVNAISGDPGQYRGAYALAAMLLYSIQLYADFSGGMDMVLGVSRMLGIGLSENFDTPYASQSLREFWQRWHMSLGSWLREYVYIPLGGNRKGSLRKLLNCVLTFLVSGLWHGAEYLLWGFLNGLFVAVGDRLRTKWKLLNQAGTFLIVTLLWAFFVWPDTGVALSMIGSLFTTFNYAEFFAGIGSLGLNLGEGTVLAASAGVLWLYDLYSIEIRDRFARLCPAGRTAVICALVLVILIFGMYGIGFDAQAFIYSRF